MSQSHKKPWSTLLECFNNKRSIEDIVLQFLQFPIANVDIAEEKERLREGMRRVQEVGWDHADYVIFMLFLVWYFEGLLLAKLVCEKYEKTTQW